MYGIIKFPMELFTIPQELLVEVLKFLRMDDFIRFSHTSIYSYKICQDELVWKHMICTKYHITEKIDNQRTWREHDIHITKSFNLNQLLGVKLLKKIVPKRDMYNTSDILPNMFTVLRMLDTYHEYTDIFTLDDFCVPRIFSLDSVVVVIYYPYNDRYNPTASICVSDANNESLLELKVQFDAAGESKLMTCHMLDLCEETLQTLKINKCIYTESSYTDIQMILLTRGQIHILYQIPLKLLIQQCEYVQNVSII